MNYRHDPKSVSIPSLSTTLIMGAAWIAFFAFAAASSLGSAASLGDAVTRLAMAVGATALAAVLFVGGLRLQRAEDEERQVRATLDTRLSRPSRDDQPGGRAA